MAAIPVDDTEAVEVIFSEHGGFGAPTKFLLTYVGTGTVYFGISAADAAEEEGVPLSAGLYLNDDDLRSQQSLFARCGSGDAGEIRILRRGPK
jgi:hypothetical protein